jgi:hypothetical protein
VTDSAVTARPFRDCLLPRRTREDAT